MDRFLLENVLVKNKKGMSYEEFSDKFYHTLRLNGRKYTEGQYDQLIKTLYESEDSLYQERLEKLGKIQFSFVRANSDLITNLIKNDDIDLVILAYDMCRRAGSIVKGTVSRKSNLTNVNESKKELLIELKNLLKSIKKKEENNIVDQARNKFEDFYGEYSNSSLADYYDTIMDSFEGKVRSFLEGELNKTETFAKDIVKRNVNNASFESQAQIQKSHRTPSIFKQTRVILGK